MLLCWHRSAALHAFTLRTLVTSWLDHCSDLLSSFPNKSLKTLSVIQNAAVLGLIKNSIKDHNSLILAFLLWLPVKSRIEFRILFITYKALDSQGTLYLKSSYYQLDLHTHGVLLLPLGAFVQSQFWGQTRLTGGGLWSLTSGERTDPKLFSALPTPSWWKV